MPSSTCPVPVNRLPYELLSSIFQVAIEDSETNEITISHVSRWWRSIAINSPTLWTQIEVNDSEASSTLASVYLERSSQSPLDVKYSRSHSSIQTFTDMILPHIDRWRSLSLEIDNADDGTAFFRLFRMKSAPMLQKLDFDVGTWPGFLNVPYHEPVFLRGTPSLREFTLWGTAYTCAISAFTTLEVIHLHRGLSGQNHAEFLFDDYTKLHAFLGDQPSLQNLVIHGDILGDVASAPIDPQLVLSNLRTLEFRASDSAIDLMIILEHILAPKLSCVIIQVDDDDLVFEHASVVLPQVTDLVYTSGNLNIERSAIAWLPHIFPNVETLGISGISLLFLSGQSYSESNPSWPKVHTIILMPSKPCPPLSKYFQALIKMLQDRKEQGYPVPHIKWPNSRAHQDHVELEGIKALTEVTFWDSKDEPIRRDACGWQWERPSACYVDDSLGSADSNASDD